MSEIFHVLIVEDDPLMREFFAGSVARNAQLSLLAAVATVAEARACLDDPAQRVTDEAVAVAPGATAAPLQAVTLVWHKPTGVALAPDQPLRGLVPPNDTLRPWHLKHLRCVSPMPAASSWVRVIQIIVVTPNVVALTPS